MEGGFGKSPLWLNEGLGRMPTWNVETIQERGANLASRAVRVWEAPRLPQSVLDEYRSVAAGAGAYTLDDHPSLAEDTDLRRLFEDLRRRVLALDACVTEEILKVYIAYKVETNFLDVIPKDKELRLSLNVRFYELNDQKGIARDVSGIGHLGNGNAEVPLDSPDQLPYVMSLVRQAFERQIIEGGANP